jgi:hypothetical protein
MKRDRHRLTCFFTKRASRQRRAWFRKTVAWALLWPLTVAGACRTRPATPDVSTWREQELSPDERAYLEWLTGVNHEQRDWFVHREDDFRNAYLQRHEFTPPLPRFEYSTERALRVKDGWLVGFNKGEWGGALYWFSDDGRKNYYISDHQIVELFSLKGGIYATEGLAHLHTSRGSIITINYEPSTQRWGAAPFAELPFAPCAATIAPDGTMLITTSDAVVAIGSDRKVRILIPQTRGAYCH